MKIRWHTMNGTLHSWSLVCQELEREMIKAGHQVFIKSTNSLQYFPDDLKPNLLPGYHAPLFKGPADYWTRDGQLVVVDPKNPLPEIQDNNFPYDVEIAYTIFFQSCRRFHPLSRCRMIIWNFETDKLPPGWQYYHKAIDYYLPSSQYSYDIFAKNGVPKNKMLVVPHGVNMETFNPSVAPFPLMTQKKVKFLHNAIPHHRKLHERVIKGYFDAFTEDDDVCLVMKTKFKDPDKDKPFEVNVKNLLEEISSKYKNPPEIEIINDKFIDNIGSLYTACDAVVSMSSTEGFCLIPDTLIDVVENKKSSKQIKDIIIGDMVVSHTGKIQKVIKTTYRDIDEEIIKIKRIGHTFPIFITKEHPVLIKNNNKIYWEQAKNLNKNNKLVIPKIKIKESNISDIDILDYNSFNNMIQKDNKIGLSKGWGHKNKDIYIKLSKETGYSIGTLKNKLKDVNNEYLLNFAQKLGWKKPEPILVPQKYELTEKFCEFLGLYIAEGCISRNDTVIISSNSEEIMAHELEKDIIKNTFGLEHRLRTKKNCTTISFDNKILATFFGNVFGKTAKFKRIPSFLQSHKFINRILKGLFYGDGTKTDETYIFTSSSLELIQNIFRILLSNNIISYITKHHSQKYEWYSIAIGRQFNKKFEEFIDPHKYISSLKTNKFHRGRVEENDDFFFIPIQRLEKIKYCGRVHNLEVENDHSYTTNGIIVHNCLPLLEALACKSLVIAPRHGGQLDFLNDNNSLLVDTKEMKAPLSMQYWTYHPDAVTGDPDTRHFSELLRKVYENPEKERARIKEEANKTAQKFSWKSASDMILDLPIPKQSKKIYNKHKILYIIPYKMAGGGEMWIRETIKKLDRNIYEPHIVFVNGISPELEDMFKDLNIIIENLEFSGKDHALKCLIESEGYSIIHFYNSLGVYNVLRSAWQQGLKCRIVETVHSDLLWPDSMVKVGKRDDLVMSIISVSKSLAQKLTKMGNKHITVFPQPINWERFKPVRNKEILKQYNIPDKFVVGFVGRMSPEKNIPAILSCAKHMPEVSFVMVGDGPQKDILSKVSSKNVYFIGRQNEVEKFYSAFDILILPSIMEGMPLVILEAMATGTPAVASNVGAIHEIIENNGLLINKPTDINGFINAIEFFKNINNWTPYSNNCLIKVEEIKTQNININNFYKNLLTGDLLNGNTSTLMEG